LPAKPVSLIKFIFDVTLSTAAAANDYQAFLRATRGTAIDSQTVGEMTSAMTCKSSGTEIERNHPK
jgi:hypothetical protein